MSRWLKQSTSIDLPIGPFLDSTDGVTAETALTITQGDIRLKKNGGAWAQKNAAQTLSHEENGYYEVTLDATDTDTLGCLRVNVSESGALPVWEDFMVLPANVWDSLFGADKLQVHADEITAGLITSTAIATNAIDADALAADAVTEIQNGLATAAALTTLDGKLDTIDNFLDTEISQIITDIAALPTAAENATELLDQAAGVETGLTVRQSLRAALAMLAAKISGAGTGTEVFRNAVADSANRLTVTVDANGNRTAITYNL